MLVVKSPMPRFSLTMYHAWHRNAPGLWSEEQVAAWKRIVDKVHAKGGYIYAQLRADGRAAVPSYIRSLGHKYVAPSAVPLEEGGEVPEALDQETIDRFVGFYANAARNAVEGAGFDGVEVCTTFSSTSILLKRLKLHLISLDSQCKWILYEAPSLSISHYIFFLIRITFASA